MELGIDSFLKDPSLRKPLHGKKISLIAHPASVSSQLVHSIDSLSALSDIKIVSAFGPQHGMKGEKQDNMIESNDFIDPKYKIPIFSLYGKVRKPTPLMMNSFDVVLVDLQDLGCRIYTFITTLCYMLQACHDHKKSLWVLDRPNPAGRPIEGNFLRSGWESFVGCSPLPMRHGLTMGELAKYFINEFKLDVDLKVVPMKGYDPEAQPGFGWPIGELTWVNPSPNAPNLSMVRSYCGTVMLEGTTLSEGRGTTRPLECVGAPDLQIEKIWKRMETLAPQWLKGFRPRICYFEPTFHKHVGKLCEGIQFHVDDTHYIHKLYQPYRVISLLFKAIRLQHPNYPLWRNFSYEYETSREPIDIISGSDFLRKWVDDPHSTVRDFESYCLPDEAQWAVQRKQYTLY